MDSQSIKIYSFDIKKILKYGKRDKENSCIVLDEERTNRCFSLDEKTIDKSSSHLTYHLLQSYSEDEIKKILICLDGFDNLDTKVDYDVLRNYKNGIQLVIDNEKINFIEFLKSGNMSREYKIFYINNNDDRKEEMDNLFRKLTLTDREDLKKGSFVISKWFAYTGLVISDCEMVDLNLDENSVVIIDDKTNMIKIDAVTSISIPYLSKMLSSLNDDYTLEKKAMINSNLENILNSKEVNELIEKNERNEITRDGLVTLANYLKDIKSLLSNSNLTPKGKEKLYEDYRIEITRAKNVTWLKVTVKDYYADINYFDGEGLIDEDYSREINYQLFKDENLLKRKTEDDCFSNRKYPKTFQIRLPYIKGMVHTTNLKQYFKDNHITEIEGISFLSKNKLVKKLYPVDKIKMILTKSQFKGTNIFEEILMLSKKIGIYKEDDTSFANYFSLLRYFGYKFGVKYGKHSNNKVCLNYQFWSTLPYSNSIVSNLNEFNNKEKDRYLSRKTILDDFAKDIRNKESKFKKDNDEDEMDSNDIKEEAYYANDYEIYKNYPDFYEATDKYVKMTDKRFDSFRRNQYKGKNYVYGFRKYLSADLLALLSYACKTEIKKEDGLKLYEVYIPNNQINVSKNKNEEYTGQLLLLRNPHYSRSEIAISKNASIKNNIRNKYFKYLQDVIFVNPKSLVAQRVGGADFDGDEVVIVYHQRIISGIKDCIIKYNDKTKKTEYRLPVPLIPSYKGSSSPIEHGYIIECLKNTFSNRVGSISNQAFCKTHEIYKNRIINDDPIVEYTILGGLEIDSAKTGSTPYLPLDHNHFENTEDEMDKYKTFEKAFISKIKPMSNPKNKKNYDSKNNVKKEDVEKIIDKFKDSYSECSSLYKFVENTLNLSKGIVRKKIKLSANIKNTSYQGIYNAMIIELLSIDLSKTYNLLKTEKYDLKRIDEILLERFKNLNNHKQFIDKFYSLSPYESLRRYCADENTPIHHRFHYLTKKEDRENYLINNYPNLTKEEIELLVNFTNDNFTSLYLILLYWKKKETIKYFEESISPKTLEIVDTSSDKKKFNMDIVDSTLKALNKTIDDVKNDAVKLEQLTIQRINGYKDDIDFNLTDELIKTISNEEKFKRITFDDLILLYNKVTDSKLLFGVYFDITKEYLGENYERIRK